MTRPTEASTAIKSWWDHHHEADTVLWLTGSHGRQVWEPLKVLNRVRPGNLVLNIGVGLGYCTRDLVMQGAQVHVLDISEVALNRVRGIVKKCWLASQLNDLPAGTYDLAISHLVTQHMRNQDLTRQMMAVVQSLKENGVFAMQFAFPTNSPASDYRIDESEASIRGGLVFRPFLAMEKIVKAAGGKIVWAKKLGIYEPCGWYGVHIIKDEEASLSAYLLEQHHQAELDFLEEMANEQLANRDYGAAADAFTRILKVQPASATAHHKLGIANRRQGSLDQAFYHFLEALKYDPLNREILKEVTEVSQPLGLASYAREIVNAFLEQFPGDPEIKGLLASLEKTQRDPVLTIVSSGQVR
ncbi:MAG: tetratricopeptide repeat protein [Terriglobia bacterium]